MQSPLGLDGEDEDLFISSQVAPCNRVKVINDPIHGHFELAGNVLDVIDTPHVQRLRDLKQLGGTYLVYPGASHNRFEHSVGVAHLSRSLVTGLYSNLRNPHAKACYDNERHFQHSASLVELAGLCHDLGHGPFSHMFDHEFLPRVSGLSKDLPLMQHEARSVMLFEHLVDEYNIDIDHEDVRHICDLIMGKGKRNGLKPAFLYDVVSNGKTGLDTDKWDYATRDVHNIGLQGAYGFDHRRLIKFAKVVDDDICFHRKEIFNVYHLFLTRYQLHRTVYNHRAALSIDGMITDAFLEADQTLKISESINNPSDFLTMTDCLVPIIERSKEASLAGARKIVYRLRRRKLYRFVDEVLLPAGVSRKITAEEIASCQDVGSSGINLVPDDIYIAHVTLNFGMKSKNPIDNVLFFKDWEDMAPTRIPSAKVSYVIPAHFEEKLIRVYSKREESCERVKSAIKRAFRSCIRRMNLGSPWQSPVVSKRQLQVPPDLPTAEQSGSATDSTSPTPLNGVATSMDERVAKRMKPQLEEQSRDRN